MVGAALYGGKSLELLKSFFEQTIDLFVPKCEKSISFYDKLNSLNHSLLSDENRLHVELMFNGSRKDPTEKGMISHINEINFTPENMMAGFLRGLCLELADFFEAMPVTQDNELCYLVGSGNAIRRNPILKEILQMTFKRKLLIPVHNEEAAFGACLCALVGAKKISGFIDAGALIDYKLE